MRTQMDRMGDFIRMGRGMDEVCSEKLMQVWQMGVVDGNRKRRSSEKWCSRTASEQAKVSVVRGGSLVQ